MTIGDVFSVVAATLGVFLTAWATVVAVALLMPNVSERARGAVAAPRAAVLRGLALVLVPGVLGVILVANGNPLAKLIGWFDLIGLLAMAAVGLSGIAQTAGRRIQDLDPTLAAYPAMARGAAFVVGATLLPILGWLGFGPLLLLGSLGAGWTAVLRAPRPIEINEAA